MTTAGYFIKLLRILNSNLILSSPPWEGIKVGSTMRKIIPYNQDLVAYAKELRKNMTLGEIALWREIKGKKLGVQFSRQIPIDQYIVDFYCKAIGLAIEVDGSIHFEEGQEKKDSKRQKRLESLGVSVIRFSDSDVKNNLDWVIKEIRTKVEGFFNPFMLNKLNFIPKEGKTLTFFCTDYLLLVEHY